MINRNAPPTDDLAGWEKWPLAALFLANALNVFILYVPLNEMPLSVQWMLPWVRVFCGIAAAASLEGTLIAVTMGRRLGRDSKWSWAAMFAASAFTAMVAYYVHAEVGLAAAGLFMAQAVVLFIYTQHLAQPRKPLQTDAGAASQLPASAASAYQIRDIPTPAHLPALIGDAQERLFPCKHCNAPVTLAMAGQHGKRYKLEGRCVAE